MRALHAQKRVPLGAEPHKRHRERVEAELQEFRERRASNPEASSGATSQERHRSVAVDREKIALEYLWQREKARSAGLPDPPYPENLPKDYLGALPEALASTPAERAWGFHHPEQRGQETPWQTARFKRLPGHIYL